MVCDQCRQYVSKSVPPRWSCHGGHLKFQAYDPVRQCPKMLKHETRYPAMIGELVFRSIHFQSVLYEPSWSPHLSLPG